MLISEKCVNKKYKLIDDTNNIVLAESLDESDGAILKQEFQRIGRQASLIEDAAAGATSATAIAVDMSGGRSGNMSTIKQFMDEFNKRVVNTKKKNGKDLFITVNEAFDIDSVFSRLSSMEKAGKPRKTEGTTFGIEDDNGNIMKVTVRADQSQEFEQEVARYLADIKTSVESFPSNRGSKDISMAELLFKMKDQFDIIDVEFPKIPSDVIYNADKASYDTGNSDMMPDDQMGAESPEGMENGEDLMEPLDLTDYEDTEGSAPEELPNGEEEPDMDADIEDLSEPENMEDTEGSILTKVIDMLKSQAESEIERAKAEAEKARAEQARYTAQATQFAIKDQEEQLRYELEMEEQKKREKEAQKLADMTKHRLSKTMSAASGIREADEGATPEMVMRQRQQISARYAILPTDSPEQRQYKALQKAEAMREWTSRYRQALNKSRFDKIMADKEAQQANKSQQQRNPQQQNMQSTGANQNEV